MNPTTLIMFALKVGVVLIVFGLGLEASPQNAMYLFRRPGQLARALLAMYILLPLFAVSLASTFVLYPAVEIALVALAVSPIPPLLPRKAFKAGGAASYTIGLLVAMGLLAIVFIPVAMKVFEIVFRIPLHMSSVAIMKLVLMSVLAPLAAGMIVRSALPMLAEWIAKPVALAAMALLVVSVLPILFIAWPAMVSLIGNGTLAACITFLLVGLTAGHLLGGPNPEDRTVLALSTASRHPGIALAIAQANFPEQKLVLPAILLYLIMSAILSSLYLAWGRRQSRQAGIAIPSRQA